MSWSVLRGLSLLDEGLELCSFGVVLNLGDSTRVHVDANRFSDKSADWLVCLRATKAHPSMPQMVAGFLQGAAH